MTNACAVRRREVRRLIAKVLTNAEASRVAASASRRNRQKNYEHIVNNEKRFGFDPAKLFRGEIVARMNRRSFIETC